MFEEVEARQLVLRGPQAAAGRCWDHGSGDSTGSLSEGRACALRGPWLEGSPHFTATVTCGKRLGRVHLEAVGDPPACIKARVALAAPVSASAKSTALCVVSPGRGRGHLWGLSSKCPCPHSEFPSLHTPFSLCSLSLQEE